MNFQSMKDTLYLGTHLPPKKEAQEWEHLPLIQIQSLEVKDPLVSHIFNEFEEFTHVLFTSPNAVNIFCQMVAEMGLEEQLAKKECIAIGRTTALEMNRQGVDASFIPDSASQEGIVFELGYMNLKDTYWLLPASSKARAYLRNYLALREARCQYVPIYTPLSNPHVTLPDLSKYKKIVFTSPSVVDAFFEKVNKIPEHLEIISQGNTTKNRLIHYL